MHFNDVLSVAARAWSETKAAGDPEFNQCQITHRENLGAAARAVIDFGLTGIPTAFDKAVLRIAGADAEAKSEADRILEANPTLHADEVMQIASGVPHPLAGHAENAQLAAVREEFKGVDVSGLTASVRLEPMAEAPGGVEFAPHPKPEALQGTITVEKTTDGKTSATVNVESKKPTKKKGK